MIVWNDNIETAYLLISECKRIFIDTDKSSRHWFLVCFTKSAMKSGLLIRHAPIPSCCAHLWGQPQFRSTPLQWFDTSLLDLNRYICILEIFSYWKSNMIKWYNNSLLFRNKKFAEAYLTKSWTLFAANCTINGLSPIFVVNSLSRAAEEDEKESAIIIGV